MENTKIVIESDLFSELRASFNKVLINTLTNMQAKGSSTAEMTLKLNINLNKVYDENNISGYLPEFKHKVSSVFKTKSEESGSAGSAFGLVFNAETGEFELRKRGDGQMTMDDFDSSDDEPETNIVDELPEGANLALPESGVVDVESEDAEDDDQ